MNVQTPIETTAPAAETRPTTPATTAAIDREILDLDPLLTDLEGAAAALDKIGEAFGTDVMGELVKSIGGEIDVKVLASARPGTACTARHGARRDIPTGPAIPRRRTPMTPLERRLAPSAMEILEMRLNDLQNAISVLITVREAAEEEVFDPNLNWVIDQIDYARGSVFLALEKVMDERARTSLAV